MSRKAVAARIAQPYAEALLEISSKNNTVSSVTEDIKIVSDTLANSQELSQFFANPLIDVFTKKKLLEKVFDQKINVSLLNFLMILTDKKRINMVESILEKFLEIAYTATNVTLAKVITSTTLSNEQQQALIEKIKLMTQATEVRLSLQVDTSLIGGFSIQIGSQIIDTSLRGQLQQMASHLDIKL
uniref:ATP synthase CF1 delta subunit n=1 Tax=Chroothece richteriana TaxID=101928 RepID=UPI001FCCE2FB|nr:ATP synthase CF1 delta subunit [Chroothece richteriana]UNJ14246.1 ATP synthase CF1 delta subunit [Chroothece richteriana]